MKRSKIDTHFEVILERVKELTEKSRKTVWYEISNSPGKSPTMVLISETGNIGFVNITYNGKDAEIYAGKLTKKVYDSLMERGMDLEEYKNAKPAPKHAPGDVVKWVTGVAH